MLPTAGCQRVQLISVIVFNLCEHMHLSIFYSTVSLFQCSCFNVKSVNLFVALAVAVTSSLPLGRCVNSMLLAINTFLHVGEILFCMHVGENIL